ncbi:uncharacterized protein HMPREF1541_05403 [Cyphellophora europaea CBS 101466]|uniref:Amino acid permease n=1 Tax=Cyphellophora europaea (strain CBS 101466) TaxID=1220924 RepID=W2RS88_CYPE1|nr:uncharacterized protein HMPREF1541_05403 [Cyphellophora europaea CBS 101466]ETN39180.1 hypothetical protein HMPREF1541_05403 [Cyphellophora europaea CBS 101466]
MSRRTSLTAQQAGYASELPKRLGMMSVLGLSFAIMAVPYGLSTTFYVTFANGQSVTIIWGWILVSLISLCIAASLAEICAVYPTSGGVYHWSAILSTRKYAPVVSFIDGWMTLVGNWTVTLSINFGGAQLILSAISIFNDSYTPNQWQTVLCFWAVTIFCALVNIFGSRYLDLINKACIYWTGASIVIILITLLVTCKDRRSAEFAFTHYDASTSGWPSGWSFFVGLLQPAYVLTGYGMVAAMCEEVQNPAHEVPKAMVLSVAAAGLTGIIYLLPILFVLPDIELLLSVPQPIGLLFKTVTGSNAGGFCLLLLILGIWVFAGVGALTAASRCTWAFARDGAIPGYTLWRRVNHRVDVPVNAVLLSSLVNMALGCIYFGSSAAFNSFTGVATICLSTSYCVPILVSLVRKRHLVRNSPFPLGNMLGPLINGVTLVWICFAVVIFCMPVTLPVSASSMNYASVVFCSFAAVSAVWYFAYARHHFKGPGSLDGEEVFGGEAGTTVEGEGRGEKGLQEHGVVGVGVGKEDGRLNEEGVPVSREVGKLD